MYPRILKLLERKDKQKTKRRRRCSRCSEIPSLSSILDTDKVYLSFLSFWNPNAPNFFAFFEALVKQVSYFHKKATPRNSYKKLLKLRHLFPQHPLLFTEIVKMRFPLFLRFAVRFAWELEGNCVIKEMRQEETYNDYSNSPSFLLPLFAFNIRFINLFFDKQSVKTNLTSWFCT